MEVAEAKPAKDPSSGRFTWKIDNFTRLNDKKIFSDVFHVGGLKWRMLVYPKGNNVDHLSVYLEAADSGALPDGWSRHARFSMSLVSQVQAKDSVRRDTKHQFNAGERVWGFGSFMPLAELHNPYRGYLANDACIVEAEVTVFGVVKAVVRFHSLEKPKEDEFLLELSKLHTYDDVVEKVAQRLGLDDPSKIRLTSHDCYRQQPKLQPIRYRGVDYLSDMLNHYNQTSDILYYEILDIPLPVLEGLKTLKVAFHHATKDEVVIHTIRLPKQSTVGDLINDLKTTVELSHPEAEIRLLEVLYHKIYRIFPLHAKIENINMYSILRAEEIPEEEKNIDHQHRIIHIYHFMKDTTQNIQPFFLAIHDDETLAEVKVRTQKKLQISDEEFAKWKFAYLSLGRQEYLQETDIVASRFQRRDVYGAWEQYLGLEHTDNTRKRSRTVSQESSLSSSAPIDTLISDIRNCIQERAAFGSLSDKEIGAAKTVFKQCLDMDVTSFTLSGKSFELKNALTVLLETKLFPDSMVDGITNFLANLNLRCEKYEAAKRDLTRGQENKDSVVEQKTTLKQLLSKLVRAKNQAEAVDSEIARLEEQLGERKAKRVKLGKKLEELAKQATTSKQALLSAENDMKMFNMKKEEAENTVSDFQVFWESLRPYAQTN